jgi:hypothetical protein
MDAAGEGRTLIRVAGFAFDRRGVVGMRIIVNVLMAVIAFEDAVRAGVEFVRAHADAFAVRILESGIVVAGEAIGIRMRGTRGCGQQQH